MTIKQIAEFADARPNHNTVELLNEFRYAVLTQFIEDIEGIYRMEYHFQGMRLKHGIFHNGYEQSIKDMKKQFPKKTTK